MNPEEDRQTTLETGLAGQRTFGLHTTYEPAARRGGRGAVRLMIGLCAVLVGVAAAADKSTVSSRPEFDAASLTSRWRIAIGGAINIFDTRAAWTPSGLTGATIELEDVLGLAEDTQTGTVAASYRFNGRHSLELRATDLSRSATRTIEEEIEWGDVIYRADAQVDSRFDFTSLETRWRYDFSDSGRLNSGLLLGLSTFRVSLGLEGEARYEDEDDIEWVDGVVEEVDVLAPVPMIGFFIDYAMSRQWILRVEASATDLDISDHEGRVVGTRMGIEYEVSRLVALGMAIGTTDIEYRQEKQDEKLGVDYRVSSLEAHLSFSF
jgi:hypothetical protein